MSAIIDFLFYSVKLGTALLFGTSGEIVTEKAGSLNLGVEGLMAMGAIGGFYFGCVTDSMLIGILTAFLTAALGGLIYAFLTVTFQANQNVTGLTLTIFGVGVYRFIGTSLRNANAFPKIKESTDFDSMKHLMAEEGIPFLRDIPYVGKLLFSYNILVYFSIALAILLWVYMSKTRNGLKLRAMGENYGAADACGVNVTLYRYLHIIMGAGITGIGGLYIAVFMNGGEWNENWINGMGWIAVALVIFAKWSTAKALFGSFLFGILLALKARGSNLSDAFPNVFGWLKSVPGDFYDMLPFLITFIVLIISSIRDKGKGDQPACCGTNYYREER